MKRKLFWIIYFATAILMIAVAALLMPEYIIFNWHSLFPVGYIIVIILLALFFPSRLNARFAIWYEEQCRIKWGNEPLDAPYFEESELVEKDYELHIQLSKTFIFFIPFWLLFIVFFFPTAKILSCLIVIAPILLSIYFTMCDVAKSDAEIHTKLEKERKEQERREELGKWH